MLKLTKTGIGLLTKQYRSVLRKCLLLNFGLFMTTTVLNLTIPNTVEANGVEIGGGSAPHFLAVAIGTGVSVGGDYAIGIGNNIVASARDAIAIGGSANATNTYAVAYGAHAKATGEGSIALGAGSISSQKDVVSVGHLGSDSNCTGLYCGLDYFRRIVNVADGINAHDAVTLGQMNNAFNYYYTFRVDKRVEAIEFAKELRSNKKEMSSLDFMPIKSSSDLQINLIKAEDPLTSSAKTRDDSLGLMEVCHA